MLGKMDIPLHGKCLRLTNYKNIKQEEPRVILCLVFLFVWFFFWGGGVIVVVVVLARATLSKKKSLLELL